MENAPYTLHHAPYTLHPDATPGPSNLNQKSILKDFDNFWR
jgi:hypothetical protein